MKLGAKQFTAPFRDTQPVADHPRFLSSAIHRFFHRTPVLVQFQTHKTEEKARKNLLLWQQRLSETYCFGAAGFGVVVGRGRAVVGAADGPEGIGAATPELALYAVTTAWVTSVLGTAHITLLC